MEKCAKMFEEPMLELTFLVARHAVSLFDPTVISIDDFVKTTLALNGDAPQQFPGIDPALAQDIGVSLSQKDRMQIHVCAGGMSGMNQPITKGYFLGR